MTIVASTRGEEVEQGPDVEIASTAMAFETHAARSVARRACSLWSTAEGLLTVAKVATRLVIPSR